MPSGSPAVVIELLPAEREHLEAVLRRRRVAKVDAQRAQVILLFRDLGGSLSIYPELKKSAGLFSAEKWPQSFVIRARR
jgi:hypothetical protein